MAASTYNVLVEQISEGKAFATVLEEPYWQVIAATRSDALRQLWQKVTQQLSEERPYLDEVRTLDSASTIRHDRLTQALQHLAHSLNTEDSYKRLWRELLKASHEEEATLLKALQLSIQQLEKEDQHQHAIGSVTQNSDRKSQEDRSLLLNEKLTERLVNAEIVTFQISVPELQPENPWMSYAGIFRDDPDFKDVRQRIDLNRDQD